MAFTLPPLPYPTNGLEPLYDKATVEVHYGKHHQAYVDKLNAAIEGAPNLSGKSVEELLLDPQSLPQNVRQAIINNGGGHANHSLFWTILGAGKGGEPSGKLADAIKKDFGSFAKFKDAFTAKATELFGSGWTFLSEDKSGKLKIMNLPNQDSPISLGEKPILLCDLWEHAYYLKFQNRRAQWIETFWKLVDWAQVEQYFIEEPAWAAAHA
jgi:Fe-Mn family superoxide dismutase